MHPKIKQTLNEELIRMQIAAGIDESETAKSIDVISENTTTSPIKEKYLTKLQILAGVSTS